MIANQSATPVDVRNAGVGARPYRSFSAHFDRLYIRNPRLYLAVVVAAYAMAALLFAVLTPAWQNPDEPAHYNNIAHIAAGLGLPVLQHGDYDQAYLAQLLETRFAGGHSITPLRYEAYQPPLYYMAAVPAYWVSGGALTAMRLFNVLLGAISIILLYLCLELVFPTKPLLVVGAAAFAALLPMHVAMNAAVNNDGLAELLLLAAMLALLRWAQAQFYQPGGNTTADYWLGRAPLLLLGVLLGLGMLTKIYAYMALALACGFVLLVVWLQPRMNGEAVPEPAPSWSSLWQGILAVGWVAVPALLLVLPVWVRNVQLYGAWDLLGLQFHDAVVAGQPTTAHWLAEHGWMNLVERALSFTFRSFWGVFGWLGVFMDERIYTLLLVLTGVVFLGILWALVRFICGRPETDMDRFQFWVLGFFTVMLLAVGAGYLWYNVKFVQHQGRYLMWGMLPIAAWVALGWREVMQPLQGKVTGFLLGLLAISLATAAFSLAAPDKLTLVVMAGFAMLLIVQPYLLSGTVDAAIVGAPHWVQRPLGRRSLRPLLYGLRVLAWATPFVLLWVLNLLIPFWYIVPQLRP